MNSQIYSDHQIQLHMVGNFEMLHYTYKYFTPQCEIRVAHGGDV
jgi:hypothetical protein